MYFFLAFFLERSTVLRHGRQRLSLEIVRAERLPQVGLEFEEGWSCRKEVTRNMDEQRKEAVAQQGREHACRLIRTGALVLDADGWWYPRDLAKQPEEAAAETALSDAEYVVWLAGYRDELRRRQALHGAVTAPFPRSPPPSDDEAEALERYEHALDCDRANHSRCDVGG